MNNGQPLYFITAEQSITSHFWASHSVIKRAEWPASSLKLWKTYPERVELQLQRARKSKVPPQMARFLRSRSRSLSRRRRGRRRGGKGGRRRRGRRGRGKRRGTFLSFFTILRETLKCFERLFHITHDSGMKSDQISFRYWLGRRHGRRRRGRGKKD